MKVMRVCALPLFCLSLSLVCPAGLAADSAGKSAKVKPYPIETCVVSGEKLGGMGEPFVFVHDGREVQLCCKSCKKDFDKGTAQFVAKIDEAAKKVKPYPKDTCLVSGEKLGADSGAIVYKGQEVKFCCKDCVKEFRKNPEKHAKNLAAAIK